MKNTVRKGITGLIITKRKLAKLVTKRKEGHIVGTTVILLEGLRETKLEQPLVTVVGATFWIW